jgi:putative redox protein
VLKTSKGIIIMMQARTKWNQNFQSTVDNGRNHSVVIDLPKEKGGEDTGASALELALMGFSGCVGTIFAMVAQKMRLNFEALQVNMTGEQKDGAKTFSDVEFTVEIKTTESEEKIQKCLEMTMDSCPVGVLFRQAGVNISHTLKML